MPENWSFHGYIAVLLEAFGKGTFGDNFATANEIQNDAGEFVHSMLLVLTNLYNDIGVKSHFLKFDV